MSNASVARKRNTPKRVSKAKQMGKNLATRLHNMGWLVGAMAIFMIFVADGYFNAWMGSLLGGTMLALLYVGIEFGLFYCMGEVSTAIVGRVSGTRNYFRVGMCAVGFAVGVYCSYQCLIAYNAYSDARRGSEYAVVDGMEDKHDFLFGQQMLMLWTGNDANAADTRKTMSRDYDRRIDQEREAIGELGFAPEFAIFYIGETLTGDEDRDKLVHQRARAKSSEMRSTITMLGILMGVILTFVFTTDFTVCDEDEMDQGEPDHEPDVDAANDTLEGRSFMDRVLGRNKPEPKTRVRLSSGSEVFRHQGEES